MEEGGGDEQKIIPNKLKRSNFNFYNIKKQKKSINVQKNF